MDFVYVQFNVSSDTRGLLTFDLAWLGWTSAADMCNAAVGFPGLLP